MDEVAAVTATELKKITGRDVEVDFAGSDLQMAREHADGVLRGMERFPGAALTQVTTYGPGSRKSPLADRAAAQSPTAYAVTSHEDSPIIHLPGGTWSSGDGIAFNNARTNSATYRADLETMKSSGHSVVGTPRGVALHEFGHVIQEKGRPSRPADAVAQHVAAAAQSAGQPTADFARRTISRYATTNESELTGEVVADVMLNGSRAAPISRSAFDLVVTQHTGFVTEVGLPKPTARLIRNAAPDVDLSQLQAKFEASLNALLRRWTDITASQRAQIVDQVRVAVTSDDLNALASMTASTTEAAQVLTEAMGQMALDAAREMSNEAMDQGVRIDPVASDTEAFSVTASALSVLLAQGLTNSAGREALRLWSPATGGDEVAAAVQEHLESLSTAFVEANLSGAMMSALTTGRMETALAGPSAALYASEYMDKRTCAPCRQINGKWIGNTDDPTIGAKVEAVYPNGGYRDCQGGVRCRGTVVSVYRPEQGPATSVTVG